MLKVKKSTGLSFGHFIHILSVHLKKIMLNFPCGPVAKTLFPVQGAEVRSLVGELDFTCYN